MTRGPVVRVGSLRRLSEGVGIAVVVGLGMVVYYVPRVVAATDMDALQWLSMGFDVFAGWAATGLLIVALAHGLAPRIRSLPLRIACVTFGAVGARLLAPMSLQVLDLARHNVGASSHAMRLEFVWTTILCAAGMTAYLDRAATRRRADAALESLRHEQREARRRLVEGRLQVLQARIDPQFFFDMLGQVRDRYAVDPELGEDLLERLTTFLRAALPQLRTSMSTLAQEAALASAYTDLLRESGGHGVVLGVAIDPAAARRPFPPGVLLPLLDAALRAAGEAPGIRPEPAPGQAPLFLAASRHAHATALSLSGTANGPPIVDEVRRTLSDVYAERASLSVLTADGGRWSIEVQVLDPDLASPDLPTGGERPLRAFRARTDRLQRARTQRQGAFHA